MSNYTYHGTRDLIALPGRSVQNFPSGLVRVERSFMCRKADVARYRNTFRANEPMPFDDGAPAIDSLFIFPEPQEQVRDDGFVEFRVTAYGRTGLVPFVERGSALGTISVTSVTAVNDADVFLEAEIPSINETFTTRQVVPQGFGLGSVLPPVVADPKVISLSGQAFDGSPRLNLVQYSSTNFGLWAEIVFTHEAKLEIFIDNR
jgi:hypothetical protein